MVTRAANVSWTKRRNGAMIRVLFPFTPLADVQFTVTLLLTHRVTGKAMLCRPVLVRPLWVGPLRVGHLRVGHLRVGARRREARLSIAGRGCVRPSWSLAVVGWRHNETRLRGAVNVAMKWVALTHDGVSVLVLGHGAVKGSNCYQSVGRPTAFRLNPNKHAIAFTAKPFGAAASLIDDSEILQYHDHRVV